MLPPLYVRPLRETEQVALEQGLRSKNAFTLRRCQILLASARGTSVREIAAHIGCSVQTVRNTIQQNDFWKEVTPFEWMLGVHESGISGCVQ
jgi:DNA-binding NarL/FixJ family response regulator